MHNHGVDKLRVEGNVRISGRMRAMGAMRRRRGLRWSGGRSARCQREHSTERSGSYDVESIHGTDYRENR
jgi:hypothetical protein